METIDLKNYWDNKHPKNPIVYKGRTIPQKTDNGIITKHLQIDVKTMFSCNDEIIKNFIKTYNISGNTNDEKILNIQKCIVQNIKYIGDNLNEGSCEYWQFPFETIFLKNGDCEDGSILLASIAINMGVPSYRLRVVGGVVQPNNFAPSSGHCYVAYLREFDNQWVAIDWCYLEDSVIPVSQKCILKNNPIYQKIHFSFNNEYSWCHQEFEFYTF